MPDTAHYALRLANGEALDSILDEVWRDGLGSDASIDASPYAPNTGAE